MNFRRRGISLIELTIVILIVGILAAVAAPRMADSVRAIKLQAAARQLAAHIDYIRNVAINEGRSTTLICDQGLHRYASDNVDFPERIGQLLLVSLPQDYDPSFTLAADFDSQASLTFDFEGVPYVGDSPLSQGRIELASGNDKYAVVIASGTGATSVQRLKNVGGGSAATEIENDASAQGTGGAST
jgi:prepilin-type N-terminal cleavage/methylation domain-containing protein